VERGAAAGVAFHLDPAVVLFDDAVHGGEPQAGSLAGLLGGEERLENVRQNLGGDPAPGILHTQADLTPGPGFGPRSGRFGRHVHHPDLEAQATALRHGVPGVDGQVHQHLLQHAHVRPYHRRSGRVIALQGDVLPDQPAQHLDQVLHDPIQVRHAGPHVLFAAEQQQLAGQVGTPLDGLHDLAQGANRRGMVFQLGLQQLGMTLDHRQDVVEVMRNARRQLANGLELLHLPQLRLQVLPLGEVAHGDDDARPTGVARLQLAQRFARAPCAVSVPMAQDLPHGRTGCFDQPAQQGLRPRNILRVDSLEGTRAHQRFRVVAQHPAHRGAQIHHRAVRRQDADHVRDVFDQGTKMRLAGLQAFFQPPPLGDVLLQRDEMRDAPRAAAHRCYRRLFLVERAVLAFVDEAARPHPPGRDRLPQLAIKLRRMRPALEQTRSPPQRLGTGVTRDPLERRVHIPDCARRVGDHDRLGGLLDGGAQQRAFGLCRRARLFVLDALKRKGQIVRRLAQQRGFLLVKNLRPRGVRHQRAEHPPVAANGHEGQRAQTALERPRAPRRGNRRQVVADQRLSRPQCRHHRIALRRGLRPLPDQLLRQCGLVARAGRKRQRLARLRRPRDPHQPVAVQAREPFTNAPAKKPRVALAHDELVHASNRPQQPAQPPRPGLGQVRFRAGARTARPQRREGLLELRGLGEESIRAQLQTALAHGRFNPRREHQHATGRLLTLEQRDQLKAAQTGQLQVQQHRVGLEGAEHLQALLAVDGAGEQLQTGGLPDQRRQSFTQQRRVFDHQHPGGRGRSGLAGRISGADGRLRAGLHVRTGIVFAVGKSVFIHRLQSRRRALFRPDGETRFASSGTAELSRQVVTRHRPRRAKTQDAPLSPRAWWCASFWTAPALWRFGKAAQARRTPRRFAFSHAPGGAPAFGVRRPSGAFGKAAQARRTPRRFAFNHAPGGAPAFGLRQPSGALGKRRGRAALQDASRSATRPVVRQLLDCASPLALLGKRRRRAALQDAARSATRPAVRQLLECASPLALLGKRRRRAALQDASRSTMRPAVRQLLDCASALALWESGAGAPHSKTLRVQPRARRCASTSSSASRRRPWPCTRR
jgi:hypothetical protein